MSPLPRHPESQEPIRSITEFNAVVSSMVPAQPVGQEQPLPDQPVPAAESPTEANMRKFERIRDRALAAGAAELADGQAAMQEPEDPWASLGGGQNTLNRLGHLPVGNEAQIGEQTIRDRRGRLVTRLTLNGTFLDVEVEEGGRGSSHARNLVDARQRIARGEGSPVSRLNRGSRNSQ